MQQARNTNHCNNHPILDSSVLAYLNLNGDFFSYISKMSVFVNNVPLKCLNLTLWLALEHYSFSLFILQDCESAEAESGIAQTTVGMYIFRSEGERKMYWCWSWRPTYGCWSGSSSMSLLGVWCFLDWFMCLTEATQRSSSARLKRILDTTKLSPKNS